NWGPQNATPGARSDLASSGRAVHAAVAEIDVEIFDLGSPVIRKGPFNAGPGGPASLGVGGSGAIEVRLHIGEGAAGCQEEQPGVRGITSAPARRRQPVISGLAIAAESADARSGTGIDCGVVPVALNSKHESAGLPIDAQRATDYAAVIASRAG